MEPYQQEFIRFALAYGLRVFEDPKDDVVLKSGRKSPLFFNAGAFNTGALTENLSEAYARTIIASGSAIDTLYGIPEKGVGLVTPVAVALARKCVNVGWFFTRKHPKEHGEATGTSDLTKLIVGRTPKDGDSICQLDDVFTSGDTKYAARRGLEAMGNFEYPLLVIALDRQEVNDAGENAVEKYEKNTGTVVASIISSCDVLDYLCEHAQVNTGARDSYRATYNRLADYLRIHGTEAARARVASLPKI